MISYSSDSLFPKFMIMPDGVLFVLSLCQNYLLVSLLSTSLHDILDYYHQQKSKSLWVVLLIILPVWLEHSEKRQVKEVTE